MDKMIERFPDQLEEAIEIGRTIRFNHQTTTINQIYIAGMGGSGIGGDFVAEWVYESCPVPLIVGKGYRLPNWVDQQTVAFVSSYSGNTEETLEVYRQLQERNVMIKAISSGGKLLQMAQKDGHDFIRVPDNWASPRACLGYSIVEQLYALNKLGLIDNTFEKQLVKAAELLRHEMSNIKSQAKEIAQALTDKFTMIYAIEGMEPVALRFRQQLNENAKTRAAHFVIPEMNHNELVGWKHADEHLAVLYFLSDYDSQRNRIRQRINKEIMSKLASPVFEIHAKGESKIEQTLYLVYMGDWISWYLAMEREMDAVEVHVIDYLKGELAKHP